MLIAVTGCSSAPTVGPAVNASGAPFVLDGITDLTQVCQLTGPDAANDTATVMVAGADLGHMFSMSDRTYFTFGDTFGKRDPGMTGGGGSIWRSNVMAWTTDADPADCIRFDGWITDEVGWAKELIPSRKSSGEVTVIPTYGFSVGDVMYLHYMAVRHWGAPGVWETKRAGLARSTDGGSTWTKLEDVTWPGEGSFQQVSVATVGDDLYFWGIPSGRFGGVQLMKVPKASVEEKAAYRYFTGTDDAGAPVWSADPAAATLVLDHRTGELSVAWNDYLQRWLMTTLADNADAVMYEGINPWGPWSEPHYLYRQSEKPGLYAPFMSPRYVADGGRTVYFSLSLWGPYNVFWYRVSLVRS